MVIKSCFNISKKRSIAIICNDAQMLLNFRSDLILELIDVGLTVYCLAPNYTDLKISKLNKIGATYHQFYLARNSINPLEDVKSFISLINSIKKIKPDALLAITSKPIIWGLLASRFFNIKSRFALFTGLGYAFTLDHQLKSKPLKNILIFLYRLSLPLADKVIFQNYDDCHEITETCNLDRNNTLVIKGTGVNLQEWQYCQPCLSPLTFTLVARLLIEKGVLEFLAASKSIKSLYPEVQFWLIGGLDTNPGGLAQSQLEEFIQSGVVEWFGFANVKEYLVSDEDQCLCIAFLP